MAHRDDVKRVLAGCEECGSVYAARRWPDGTIRMIGRSTCRCGSSDFVVVTDSGDGVSSADSGAE